MVLGSCCFIKNEHIQRMNAKSVIIEGTQHGFIVNFEITQTFSHSEKDYQEIIYIFPNDLKICIFDTTFVVGEQIIKPKLKSKEEAQNTYKEAIESNHFAVYGSNIDYRMTEFKLGNVPPETDCKVILKIAFTAQMTTEKSFFIKFPLDVYTPSGSCGCLDTSFSYFHFKLQSNDEIISKITSNIINGKFDTITKTFSINEKIQSYDNQNSIIINFESKEQIQSSILLAQSTSSNYDFFALTIAPNLSVSTNNIISEFIFVVDCSFSMAGSSINKASQCLDIFIRSLPPNTYYNVYKFGSNFTKLFNTSMEYTEQTAKQGINLAMNLIADLGGTNIYDPLNDIFYYQTKHGQRQIFILTDGEVEDVKSVLQLISNNSVYNRCFTIGIGRGCDAGLVEGMARASGGISNFVQEGDSISEKLIPQLQSSLNQSLTSVEIHLDGQNNDDFMISPFPIPVINIKGTSVVFIKKKKQNRNDESLSCNVLITGNYNKESIEIPVEKVELLQNYEEDKFGCSHGRNISGSIMPLFAYYFLKSIEQKRNISEIEKEMAIEMSISSGVLCNFTGYVGMTEIANDYTKMLKFFHSLDDTEIKKAMMKSFSESKGTILSSSWNDFPNASNNNHFINDSNGKFDFMTIIRLQNITGFWEDLDTLNKLLGTKVNYIDNIKVGCKELEIKCVATILALAALRMKAANDRSSWLMIEQKAINWLKNEMKSADVEEIITMIQNII